MLYVNMRHEMVPDDVPRWTLRVCAEQLAESINCSMTESSQKENVPQNWKKANIYSIHMTTIPLHYSNVFSFEFGVVAGSLTPNAFLMSCGSTNP